MKVKKKKKIIFKKEHTLGPNDASGIVWARFGRYRPFEPSHACRT
jgi:hypothetical protein